MWFTFGGGGEDREEIHVAENFFFSFWICEFIHYCMSLLTASDHFASIQWISSTIVLCLKENVALMVWEEVFSISELLKLLMGVESKWFNAQFRGMASRKPLCLNNKWGIILMALQRCSRAAVFQFVQAKCRFLISGILEFILYIRKCTATTVFSFTHSTSSVNSVTLIKPNKCYFLQTLIILASIFKRNLLL